MEILTKFLSKAIENNSILLNDIDVPCSSNDSCLSYSAVGMVFPHLSPHIDWNFEKEIMSKTIFAETCKYYMNVLGEQSLLSPRIYWKNELHIGSKKTLVVLQMYAGTVFIFYNKIQTKETRVSRISEILGSVRPMPIEMKQITRRYLYNIIISNDNIRSSLLNFEPSWKLSRTIICITLLPSFIKCVTSNRENYRIGKTFVINERAMIVWFF